MSLLMRGTRLAVRLGTARQRRTPVSQQLAGLPPEPERRAAPVPRRLRRRFAVHEQVVHGRPVLHLVPRRGASGRHVVFVHGGAYAHPLGRAHWWVVDRVTRGTGVSVTVPLYRLAPEGDAEQAHALLGAVLDGLPPEADVTLAGDSAGGALALAHAQLLRDAGASAVSRLVLLSPWLDATLRHPQVAVLQHRDVVLQAPRLRVLGRLWAGGLCPSDPRVSPALGSIAGLPAVHVVVGSRELLLPDAAALVDRIRAYGGEASLQVARGGFHDFVGAWWTPEARRAHRSVRSMLRPAPGR